MATIETVEDLKDNNIEHTYSLKRGKRRHKTRSLVVPKTPPSAERANACLSADCDSLTQNVRRRFSFRKFRTVKSFPKLGLPHSRSSSTYSVDAAGANVTTTNESKCTNCSITSIDHAKDISQISSDIQSK